MTKLPAVSGKQAIAAFERAGWVFARQRGSHVMMKRRGHRLVLTIPLAKELDRGLLRRLIRDAGLTVNQFREYLKRTR